MIKHKDETLKLLDIMIENAEQGPSGFWTEDFEGCGNPKIFPEFEAGLKSGRLVRNRIIFALGILLFFSETVAET